MKKGFTLIELLAVIVILAIIALIATPIIVDIISNSRSQSRIRSAEIYLSTAELAVARESLSNEISDVTCTVQSNGYLNCDDIIIPVEMSNTTATEGTIVFSGGKIVSVENLKINNIYFSFDNNKKLVEVSNNSTKSSCFVYPREYETIVDISYDNCMTFMGENYSQLNASEMATLCNGGKVDGMSIKDAIEDNNVANLLVNAGVITITSQEKSVDYSTIVGYTCSDKNVVIPGKINGIQVTSIGEDAFRNMGLMGVTIPDGVVSIGDGAFYENNIKNASGVEKIISINNKAIETMLSDECFDYAINYLQGSATILGFANNAGSECSISQGFPTIIERFQVKQIGDYAFSGCTADVTIPEGIVAIGNNAFSGCNFTTINIPQGVKTIGDYAFADGFLQSISIPSSVVSIGTNAFDSPGLPEYTIIITIDNVEGAISGSPWTTNPNVEITYTN